MGTAVPVAFPFVEVTINTQGLAPVAQRSPGVIAIVGASDAGAAAANVPFAVDTLDQAADLFAGADDAGVVRTRLYNGLELALLQDPKPSRIYGVKADPADYPAALAALEAADDVTFVAIAGEAEAGSLVALKTHVETMSAQGQKRIGVAMVDPAIAKSTTYAADVAAAYAPVRSDVSRMVLVAARGAERVVGMRPDRTLVTIPGDAASAAVAAMAGYPPHASLVLKRVVGFAIPVEQQFSPTEIKALSAAGIDPVIDPALIEGESLHFAEGRLFTADANLLYIDIVRTLDDIEFRLKAGLIGMVGDARITRAGLTRVAIRVDGILGPLRRAAVIDDYAIDIPVLNVLNLPESTWTATDREIVRLARQNRTVDMNVTVTYGPAVHRLLVTLLPKF
jgi:hypothetical protein